MGKAIDITSQRFGKLVVLARQHINKYGNYIWLCKCDCGKILLVRSGCLTSAHTLSCGCSHIKHGLTHTYIYSIWSAMKQRCYNKNNKYYKNYGGRGIIVCKEWKNSFETFLHDMGSCPLNSTLERIDNNKDYNPLNCKWSTQLEQRHNSRRRTILSLQETKNLYKNFGIKGY